MPVVAVQSWSLQRTLGRPVAADSFPWPGGMEPRIGTGLPLLDLPAELARRDYRAVQLCHFQLPSRDAGYLADLRGALDDAGIELDALLLDTGDLSSPDQGDEQERWARTWIADAASLGARRIRLIGGRRRAPKRSARAPHASAGSRATRRGSAWSRRTGVSCSPDRTRSCSCSSRRRASWAC